MDDATVGNQGLRPLELRNASDGTKSRERKDTIEGGGTEVSRVPHAEEIASAISQRLQDMTVAPRNSTPVQGRSTNGLSTPRGCSPTFRVSPHSSSPSTSQVSVGSVGPTLVASALARTYDLTPVMRNTSSAVDEHNFLVSPDDDGDLLHGEHLAMPSDLMSTTDGPVIPPLRAKKTGEPMRAAGESILPKPIEFPSRRHFSFTARESYDDYSEDEDSDLPLPPQHRPYQPTRDEEFGVILPEGELAQIFNPREGDKNHRLLSPIALEERQLSIPSLHRASHVVGSVGSITSYTENDDESFLNIRYHDDEASLSSKASSLYLEDTGNGEPLDPSLSRPWVDMSDRKRKQHQRAIEWLHSVEGDAECVAEAASSKFLNNPQHLGRPDPLSRQLSAPQFKD